MPSNECRKVLVTGASGFVGRHMCESLVRAGFSVSAAVRREFDQSRRVSGVTYVHIGDIGPDTAWQSVLPGTDAVVHLAAVVHRMNPLLVAADQYSRINVAATGMLARSAASVGVKKFVFFSSVKVNGEGAIDRKYTADDEPAPKDLYACSKLEAERLLALVSARSDMQLSIVRPPLIYGPGVGANFQRLIRWVQSGIPLPFGSIENQRSLVSVWNLCDLVRLLLETKNSAGTWMVSDNHDLSTPELIRQLAGHMGLPARLVGVPEWALHLAGRFTGREAEIARLCGSLTVDVEKTMRDLQWSPTIRTDEGLHRTVQWYVSGETKRAR